MTNVSHALSGTKRIGLLCLLFLSIALTCRAQDATQPKDKQAALTEASELSAKVVGLHNAKKYEEALPLAKRVVTLRLSALGENDSRLGNAYANVGALYVALDDMANAQAWYEKALTSYTNAGLEDLNVALLLDSLTRIAWHLRSRQVAIEYGERALAMKEKLFGQEHYEVADALMNLIRVHESLGSREKAVPLYLRILGMIEHRTPSVRERTAQVLVLYNCWLHRQKQNPETLALEDRVERALREGIQTSVPLDGGILNGRALLLFRPEYPSEARQVGASGTVLVKLVIDECGNVISATAVSGPAQLRRVSEDAARHSKFSPTLLSDLPVKVAGVLQFNFVRM
jgi:tetratricopeptide (TPR) repeat protein